MNPINFYSNFSNVENALNMVSNDVKNKIKLFYKNNIDNYIFKTFILNGFNLLHNNYNPIKYFINIINLI